MLVKEFKIYVFKRAIFVTFSFIFFNVNSSFNIGNKLLKFAVMIIDTLMEGKVSQNSYLGPC